MALKVANVGQKNTFKQIDIQAVLRNAIFNFSNDPSIVIPILVITISNGMHRIVRFLRQRRTHLRLLPNSLSIYTASKPRTLQL